MTALRSEERSRTVKKSLYGQYNTDGKEEQWLKEKYMKRFAE